MFGFVSLIVDINVNLPSPHIEFAKELECTINRSQRKRDISTNVLASNALEVVINTRNRSNALYVFDDVLGRRDEKCMGLKNNIKLNKNGLKRRTVDRANDASIVDALHCRIF